MPVALIACVLLIEASIGPGGIEIGWQDSAVMLTGELQSDRVELKCYLYTYTAGICAGFNRTGWN